MNFNKKILMFITLILLLLTSPVLAKSGKGITEFQKGKVLYDKKMYKKAYPFLLNAAKKGNAKAMMHLGKMFYNGWGVPHSHKKGHDWHSKAAKLGNKESIKKLHKMNHH